MEVLKTPYHYINTIISQYADGIYSTNQITDPNMHYTTELQNPHKIISPNSTPFEVLD